MTNGNFDLGLLILRLWFGLEMALGHGLPKLFLLLNGGGFADPIGLGETTSLVLAIFAELVCGLFIAAGFFTRLSLIPYLITMLVAAFVVHAADWGSMETWGKVSYPLAYAAAAVALLFTGPGRLSLDHQLFVRKFK